MTGKPSGSHRYYALSRSQSSAGENSLHATKINADEIENKVLSALVSALQSPEMIGATVRSYVSRRLQEHVIDSQSLDQLRLERERAINEIRTIYSLGRITQEALKGTVNDLENQVEELDRRIAVSEAPIPFKRHDVDAVIKSVTSQCADAVGFLGDRKSASFRHVLKIFVPRLVVDLETRDVEMDVALPSWGIHRENRIMDDLRLASLAVDGNGRQTQLEDYVPLLSFSCLHARVNRQPCLTCKRLAKAA